MTFGSKAGVGTSVETGELADGAVTNAKVSATAAIARTKLADVSATSRVIGRKTAGAGADEELTLSDIMDFIGSAAQGDILYRGAATWARLGAGTSGQFLKTQGAGANPLWADAGLGWTIIKKSADQSRNTTTTLTADSELTFAVTANKTYFFRVFAVFYSASATPDFKFAMNGPASPVVGMGFDLGGPLGDASDGISVNNGSEITSIARAFTNANTGYGYVKVEGFFINGANAGNVSFEWAQNTSDATDVTVKKGSYLEYYEIT